MSLSSVLSNFQFDTGSGLATIAEVISCEEDASRTLIETTPIGTGAQTLLYGVFSLTLQIEVAYKRSDHVKLSDQLVLASTAKAAKYIRATGDECTGSGFVSHFRVTSASGQYITASFTFRSSGAWTINGSATA